MNPLKKSTAVQIDTSYNEEEIPWIVNTLSKLAPKATVGRLAAQVMRDNEVP